MGVLVMLLACLTIIGTAMSTPIVSTPTKLNNLTSILPKGWTTDDLVKAFAAKGRNVSSTQQETRYYY